MPSISDLPSLSAVASGHLVPIVDDPATSRTNKATVASLLSLAWPIGSVFVSVANTNPATLLGFGTWVAFGTGRCLVGLDAGQTEFDTLEKVGGEKTHTLVLNELTPHAHVQDAHNHTQDPHNHTQDPHTHTQNSHNHTQDAHNHTQDPHTHIQNAHSHVQAVNSGTTGGLSGYTPDTSTSTSATSGYSTASTTATNQNATATNQAATATNQAATATNQNATATNQATTATNQAATATNQNTGGGAAHNNLQPYVCVCFWKRTA